MEPKTFVVIRLDGDYALLQRIDQQEEEPTPVARALLPEDLFEGARLRWEAFTYTLEA